ncbi:hypothetical protein BS47DRAFT_1353643, partial [Hydnum rufescens UP504]
MDLTKPSISPPHSLLDRLSIPHPPVEPSKDGGAPFRPSSPMPPMSFDTFQFSSLTTKGVPSLLQRMFHSGHPSLHSPADLREKQTAPPLNNSTLQEIPVVSVLNGNSKVSQSIDTEGAPPFPSGSEDMIVELSSQISQSSSTAYLPPLEASSPSQPNSLSIHLTQQDIRTTLAPAPLLSPFSLVSSGMLPPTPMSAPSYTHEHAFVQNFFPLLLSQQMRPFRKLAPSHILMSYMQSARDKKRLQSVPWTDKIVHCQQLSPDLLVQVIQKLHHSRMNHGATNLPVHYYDILQSVYDSAHVYPFRTDLFETEAKTEASSLVDYEAPSYSNQPSVRGPHNAQYRTASISESLEAPVLNHGDCLDAVPAYSRPRHKDPSEEQGRGLPEQDLGPTPRSPDVHGRPASRVNDNDGHLTGEKPVVPRDDPSHAISSHPPVNSRFDGPTPDIPGTVKPIESPFVQSSTPITRQRSYPTSNNTGIPQASVLPSLVSPKPQLVTTQDLRAEGFPIPKESTTTAPLSSSDPSAPTSYPEVDSGLGGPDDYGNDSIEALRPDENSESHLDSKVPMQTDTPLQPSPESSGRRANRSLRRTPGESRSQIPSRGQSPDPFQTRYSPRSRRHHDTWLPEPSPPHHHRSIPYAQRRSRSPSPRLNQHRWKEASSYRSRYRRSLSPVQIGDTSPALDRPSSPVRTEGARLHTRKGQAYVSDPVRGSAWRPPAPPSRSLSPRYELVTRPVRGSLPSSALEADHTNNANAEPSKDTVPIPPSPSMSPVIRSPAAGQLVRSVALPPRPTTPSLTASMGHKEITNPDSTSSESDVKQPRRVNYSSGSLLSASRKASIPERPPQYPGTSSLSVLRRLGTLSDRLAAGDSRSAEEGLFPDRLDTPVSQALTVTEGPKKSLLSPPLISQDDNHRRNRPGSMVAMDDTSPISSASLFSRVGGSPTRQRVNPLARNHIQDKNTSNTESGQPAPTGSSDSGGPGSRPRGRSRGRGNDL